MSECCTHSHTAVRFSASSGGLTETGWQSFQMVFWVLLPNSKSCKSVTLECVYGQRFVSQWLAILIALIKAVFWVGTITGLDYWTPRHSQDSGRGPGSSTKKIAHLLWLKVQLCTWVLIIFVGLNIPSRYWHFFESVSKPMADSNSSLIIDVFTDHQNPVDLGGEGVGGEGGVSSHSCLISGDISWSWVNLATCSSPPPMN